MVKIITKKELLDTIQDQGLIDTHLQLARNASNEGVRRQANRDLMEMKGLITKENANVINIQGIYDRLFNKREAIPEEPSARVELHSNA